MSNLFAAAVVLLVSYFLGCINGSVMTSHFVIHDDVRQHGSGQRRSDEFLPHLRREIRAHGHRLRYGQDRCCLPYRRYMFHSLLGDWTLGLLIAGIGCELGHMFPVFFGFRGGKGILSGGTIVLMLDWRVALVAWGLFVVLWLSTKYVSLGSIAATASMPVTTFFVFSHNVLYTVLSAAIAALVIWCHRGNIQRLLSGTEKKFKWHVNPIREDDGK